MQRNFYKILYFLVLTFTLFSCTLSDTISSTTAVKQTTTEEVNLVYINGLVSMNIEVFSDFEDPGITKPEGYTVILQGNVNTSILGQYILDYTVLDENGITVKEITRVVNVVDSTAPTINISNVGEIYLGFDFNISDLYSVSDNYYSIEDLIINNDYNLINPNNTPGTYIITVKVEDLSGNAASATIEVDIILDYFYIIENINFQENNIFEIEYDETGPNPGDSYWIKFSDNVNLNVNNNGDFWIAYSYSQNDHWGLVFFSGNFQDLSNTRISMSIKNAISTETSWLRLDNFDASLDYTSLDLSESSFENPAVIDYQTALDIFNEVGLETINRIKYIYNSIFKLN